MLVIKDHKIDGIDYIPSPNCEERPKNFFPEIIVIHAISLPKGKYITKNIVDLFTNNLDIKSHSSFESLDGIRVSAHILISREGNILQFVPFNKKAWHAGESVFKGRLNCNEFSIGIELEGCEEDDFTQNQYKNLVNICLTLFKYYPEITRQNVVGHSEIAPGRKTDPGKNFNWEYLRENL
jgi:AmpD protein